MNRYLLLIPVIFTVIHANAQMKGEIFEFEFEQITLNGVLNVPENDTPKGLILIIHGDGQTNAVAQEWFYDVRATFIQAGYAVFMWDKMGCGKSGGTYIYDRPVQSTALEVIAAINHLKKEEIPGADKIGLWGISRAGWIIPLVINQYEDIEFWISISGVDDKESFRYLFEENLKINGVPKDSIDILRDELTNGYRLTHAGESFESYMNATQNLRNNKFLNRFNNGRVTTEEGYYEYQKFFMKEQFDEESGLQVYIKDFESILSDIDCPVLALFGETDKHVDWKKTKALYEKTLSKNTDLTIKSFSGCNHNMFKCKTGGFYEFQDNNLPWDRCDGFLDEIANWLNEVEITTKN